MLSAEEIAPERPRPLTRAEYDQLVGIGAFEDERIELLYGMLVEMSPQKPDDAFPIQLLTEWLIRHLQGRAQVRVQLPLALTDDSEPEPDIAVVAPGDYSKEHPASALLVIEVARDSLKKDQQVKGRLYASVGVPEYWIVNLIDRVVERYTAPTPKGYARSERVARDGKIALVRFPDVTVSIADLLPA